jgi:hypothetical protein
VAVAVGSYQDSRERWARWVAMEGGKGVEEGLEDGLDGVELMERK